MRHLIFCAFFFTFITYNAAARTGTITFPAKTPPESPSSLTCTAFCLDQRSKCITNVTSIAGYYNSNFEDYPVCRQAIINTCSDLQFQCDQLCAGQSGPVTGPIMSTPYIPKVCIPNSPSESMIAVVPNPAPDSPVPANGI